MSEATESPTDGDASATTQQNPHAESVRKLASAMLRTAIWPSAGTVVLAAVVAAVWVGVSGLLGAVIGGAVAFGSSLATIWLMRWTSAAPLMFVMVAALAGYIGKMIVLLVVMTLLGGIDAIHTEALAFTLLATILVWTGAEVHAFRKTKIPTIVPNS